MVRGDVHRFYRTLRRSYPTPPVGPIPHLNHVREIATYYAGLEPADRQLLLAWARKEEGGMGIIPTTLSGVPVLGLIFTPLMQPTLKHMSLGACLALWTVGAVAFVAGVYIHFRQRAYTALHIHLLEYLCGAPTQRRHRDK